jgi:hypothetical protein
MSDESYLPHPSARSERLVELKNEIARRLRAVCQHMPDDEFETLVERAARIELKYEQSTASRRQRDG